MKVKIISLLVLLLTVTLSCKKDDLMLPDLVNEILIKEINVTDKPQFEFIYNNSKLISNEKSKYIYTNYSYNEKNQLVTTDYYVNEDLLSTDKKLVESALTQEGLVDFVSAVLGGTVIYEYNTSAQLIKAVTVRPSETTSEYSEYKYDDNNRISRELLYWDNKVLGYIDYLYDDRGNLISEALYSISASGLAELNTTTQYEFDNKHNPFRSLKNQLSPGIDTNPNNITKEIFTIHSGRDVVSDIVQVTTITYVYSSVGFPVRRSGTIEYLYD